MIGVYHLTNNVVQGGPWKQMPASMRLCSLLWKHRHRNLQRLQQSHSLPLKKPEDVEYLVRVFSHLNTANPCTRALVAETKRHSCTEDDKNEFVRHAACFLHREMPIRFAHGIVGLDQLEGLREMRSSQLIRNLYMESFTQIRATPIPDTAEEERIFAREMKKVYERHGNVLMLMAKAVYELRKLYQFEAGGDYKEGKRLLEENRQVQAFLDHFYSCRIAMRTYIGHYLALREDDEYTKFKYGRYGMLNMKASPAELAKMAVDDASFICEREHGDAPKVSFHGRLDLDLPYIDSHLHYMLLEVFKNSMRATVEHHRARGRESSNEWPEIKVIIADGEDNEDVTIKIADEGGGIKRSHLERMWSYLFTTADPSIQQGFLESGEDDGADHSTASPLAGLGYGLPITRAYARLFGGEMEIVSMEGHGTDALIHLSRLHGGTKKSVAKA